MPPIEDAQVLRLMDEKKTVTLNLRNGGKITAVIVGQNEEYLLLHDAVAEKISKNLVESISEAA